MSKINFTTRNAHGKQFTVKCWGGESDDRWQVTVTDDATMLQDHGTFEVQDDGLFGCSGLDSTDTDDVVMIQNEIAQILADDDNDGTPEENYFSPYDLLESGTNNLIRKATWREAKESAIDGPEGHIKVGATRCYVEMSEAQAAVLRGATAKTFQIYCGTESEASELGSALTANNGSWTTSGRVLCLTVDDRTDGGWDWEALEKILDEDERVEGYSEQVVSHA